MWYVDSETSKCCGSKSNWWYTPSEANQEKIVEAGGLGSLLMLLQSSEDETIRRVAAGAVANLAMNGRGSRWLVWLVCSFIWISSLFEITILNGICVSVYVSGNAETNQELIMAQGGIGLLARTADDAEDPQTLRMVAGAIANLCGNGS